MPTYLTPKTWGDGVTNPQFLITGPGGTLDVLMPPLLEAFEPELNEGIIKTAKYTGRIAKVLRGNTWDARLHWILTADRPVLRGNGMEVLPDLNYLDVIYYLLNVDAKMDTVSGCSIYFSPHGQDMRAPAEARDFRGHSGIAGWPMVKIRLTNRADILRALAQKTVAKDVTLEIRTDGYIERIPINTAKPPKVIYEL